MLKQTVNYEDFDGNSATDTLYFNVTKAELSDNLHLLEHFKEVEKVFAGGDRTLEIPEVQQILDLVKTVMRLSYGLKSTDGKRFVKNDELWTEFTQTAAYDTFLMSLFENPEKANEFLLGVFPRDLIDQAAKQVQATGGIPQPASQPVEEAPQELRTVAPPEEDTRPAYIREGRKPTSQELRSMSKDELVAAMQMANQ